MFGFLSNQRRQRRAAIPSAGTEDHVALQGQSLSLGNTPGNQAIVSSSLAGHRMLNTGVRAHYDYPGVSNVNTPVNPLAMASLVTLAEQLNTNDTDHGETFATGIATWASGPSITTAMGRGAYSVDQLKMVPDTITNYVHFQNAYAAAYQVRDLLEAENKDYNLKAVIWKQGEADAAADMTGSEWGTKVTAYRDEYLKWMAYATITDTSGALFILDQMAVQWSGTTYSELMLESLSLHKTPGNGIICAGPTYAETYDGVNNVHFTPAGYREYGERLGRIIEVGESWNPCYITSAIRTGTSIVCSVSVPVPPLVVNETLVAAVADNGFTYDGAAITDVSLTGDSEITITIDSDSPGTLRYALDNATVDQRVGTPFGPRGTICDSESAVSVYSSRPLVNWLCVDEWSL